MWMCFADAGQDVQIAGDHPKHTVPHFSMKLISPKAKISDVINFSIIDGGEIEFENVLVISDNFFELRAVRSK